MVCLWWWSDDVDVANEAECDAKSKFVAQSQYKDVASLGNQVQSA